MRTLCAFAGLFLAVINCGGIGAEEKACGTSSATQIRSEKGKKELMEAAKEFLQKYQTEVAKRDVRASLSFWKAANSGKKEDFDASADASLALRKYHSDPAVYKRLSDVMTVRNDLSPVEARALHVAELTYRRNQLPPDLLKKMIDLSTEIERMFNTFRAEIDGEKYSNNDLLEVLREETDSDRRKETWQALKQVGGVVAPKLVDLAKLRNQAADQLGFENYWDMSIRLQEHEPRQLLAIFDELERLTREPFGELKPECHLDYIPVKTRCGNAICLLAGFPYNV